MRMNMMAVVVFGVWCEMSSPGYMEVASVDGSLPQVVGNVVCAIALANVVISLAIMPHHHVCSHCEVGLAGSGEGMGRRTLGGEGCRRRHQMILCPVELGWVL